MCLNGLELVVMFILMFVQSGLTFMDLDFIHWKCTGVFNA
jgi:hypothetical protein